MSTNFFRVATYNILDPATAVHSANYDHNRANPGVKFNRKSNLFESNWDTRKKNIAKNIENSNAGIVCLQEVTSAALKNIIDLLSGLYKVAIHGSHESTFLANGAAGEMHGVAILYKPSEFNLLLKPSVIGRNRKVAIAQFEHITSNKVFNVASLHLLHSPRDQAVQIRSANEILEKVSKFKDCILCGDFNCSLQMNTPIVKLLSKNFFENCGNPPPQLKHNEAIDGIFCKFVKNGDEGIILETTLATQRGTENNRHLPASDHSLLYARIDLQSSEKPKSQLYSVSTRRASTDSWDSDFAPQGGGGGGGGNSSCSDDFKQFFGDGEDTFRTSQKKSSRSNSSNSFEDSSRSDSPDSQGGLSHSSSSASLVDSSCSDFGSTQGGSSHSSSSDSLADSSRSDSPDSKGRSSSLSSFSKDGSSPSSDSSQYVSVVDSGSDSSDSEDNGVQPLQNRTEKNEPGREKTWEDYADEDF